MADRCSICMRPANSTGVEGRCEASGSRLCYQLGHALLRLELGTVKGMLAETRTELAAALERELKLMRKQGRRRG